MNRTVVLALFTFAVLFPPQAAAGQQGDLEQQAAAWLALLEAGQFDSAAIRVATAVQGSMSSEQLSLVWPQIVEKFGELEKTAPMERTEKNGYPVVQLLGTFSKGARTIQVAFDMDGQVVGFFVLEPPGGGGSSPWP